MASSKGTRKDKRPSTNKGKGLTKADLGNPAPAAPPPAEPHTGLTKADFER